MMSSYKERLLGRKAPIRVAIAGAGEFGLQIATQISYIRGMEVAAVADLSLQTAVNLFRTAGYHDTDIVIAKTTADVQFAMENGHRVVVENAMLLMDSTVDVVCDVTGDPVFGAEFSLAAIQHQKHVVVVNIESDMAIGAILRRKADENGVIYTEGDGDQPSLIKGLYDWADVLGLEIFSAGKWTHLTPQERDSLLGKRTDIGYRDGSKNQVEMCCVANMTGLIPDIRGMHMPSLRVNEILNQFALVGEGGLFRRKHIIDVVNCFSPDGEEEIETMLGGGVFIIVSTENPVAQKAICQKGLIHNKEGSRALIYRPYHLVGIETPISIMKAVLDGKATGCPLPTPVADVISIAKKDLCPRERLDGIGGSTVRGEVEQIDIARKENFLPLALADGVSVNRFVPQGTPLTYEMLQGEGDNMLWKLRREQDRLFKSV